MHKDAYLYHADCRDALRQLPDDCIDSVVTDPPYHLTSVVKRFGAPGSAPAQFGTDGAFARASTGFMGKQWDGGDIAFQSALWAEMWRVLKPGGHIAAFGSTRGYHRMACAIEDAGFEIRDSLMWVYSTGFPKSQDVSKFIDKAGGISPRDQAALLRERREAASMSRDDLAIAVGCTVSSVRDWEEGRARATGRAIEWLVPSDDYRAKLADILGYSADERELIGVTDDRRGDETVIGLGHSGQLRTGGHTPAAREWEGWGTALKPAFEPIVLARKPLSEGTVAANVLRWRTGALNIDGTRVGTESTKRTRTDNDFGLVNDDGWKPTPGQNGSDAGRWPANVVLTYPEETFTIRDNVEHCQRAELETWLAENAEH